MNRIIRIKQHPYDDEFFAELVVDANKEQLARAKETFYKYLNEDEENGKDIDYGNLLMETLTDCGIPFKYVPYESWYI